MFLKNLTAVIATIVWISQGHAVIGSGVRGGGHTITSTPGLMDITINANCEWKTGEDLLSKHPTLLLTLKNLVQIDWYFASSMEGELKNLNYCFTGNIKEFLKKEDIQELDYLSNSFSAKLTGYRFETKIYIDRNIFEEMNEVHRSMLILHEVMHSYFPMEIKNRAFKLRSFIKALDDVRTGQTTNRNTLHYSMKMNEVSFPLTVARLDKEKEAVLFHTATLTEKAEKIKQAKNPEIFLSISEEATKLLAPWDQEKINENFREGLIEAMKGMDKEELSQFVKSKKFEKVNPTIIALSRLYAFSDIQRQAIVNQPKMMKFITKELNNISKATLDSSEGLIKTTDSFSMAYGVKRNIPVIELSIPKVLPESLNWIVEALILLNNYDKLDILTENEDFYAALGLKNQKALVNETTTKIKREKVVVLQTLDLFSRTMIREILEELSKKVNSQTYEKIKASIKLEQF